MNTYTELTTIAQWEDVLEQTNTHPAFVFKHSTSCPISAEAHEAYQTYVAQNKEIPTYLVKVIETRDVSNAIEADTRIKHESPQLLLLSNKEVVWHASHYDIKEDAILTASETVKK
ncbi:bacillithiol system redox-active protein YtxJ [Aliibacillus thermotolerans]|uniref:Bacillithiol system redox-active protein YtxJ n=1 Tax=Aliibacillus thermotolerans TaxID=1834418 RepID=A0ABW0U7P6_9BACI|nr:bacillithiol system redox-active protein YtxJ [Aliibacillus thermotolerans]MDA3129843.1 bacillithiol system redox-active protein YtxJ [Aliibacillus thermotolerans]